MEQEEKNSDLTRLKFKSYIPCSTQIPVLVIIYQDSIVEESIEPHH